MATWTDDFNRADGNLEDGANWDGDMASGDSIYISTNTIWLRGGSGRAGSALVAPGTFTADDTQTAQGTITTIGSCLGGLIVRGTQGATSLSGYGIEVKGTEIKLYSYDNWNYSHLAGAPGRDLLDTWTATVNVADVVILAVDGTSITVTVNGTQRLSATDSDHASGQPGFAVSTAAGTFFYWDDFEATTPDKPGGGTPFSIGMDGSWNRNMGHP
jgi:hypothetical protein